MNQRSENRADLREWTRSVRDEQDAQLEAFTGPSASETVVALRAALSRDKPRARRAKVTRLAFAALAALASLALFVAFRWNDRKPLAYTVHEREGQLGESLGERDEMVPVRFSDGTILEFAPDSRARIVEVGPRGAKLALERGRVHLDVVPRASGAWNVLAGPFDIHVRGTVFDAGWDDSARALRVKMYEGHVVVTAPCLPGEVHLRRGDDRVVECPRAESQAPSTPATPSPTPPNAPSPVEAAPLAAPAPKTPRPKLASEPLAPAEGLAEAQMAAPLETDVSPPLATLTSLVGSGRYHEALELAAPVGVPAYLASLDARDAILFGDAARFDRNFAIAQAAYEASLTKAPGPRDAARAQFLLGRFAIETHDRAEAERRFAFAITADPNGELAAEAEGHLLELAIASGDAAKARHAALTYLEHHPNGTLADVARSKVR